MSALFEPMTLRSVTLPNPIYVAPMCQYSAEQGLANDWHMIHLGGLAKSGAAMLSFEATAVESCLAHKDGEVSPRALDEAGLDRIRGWDLGQTIEYAAELKRHGADWIGVCSGGIAPLQQPPVDPGFQVPFAQAIKEATGANTIAGGLITDAQRAADILSSGIAPPHEHKDLFGEIINGQR
jgi:2,4-dienoyl-CoA reductase-like NADH-dependent reductase (Old Yellow Enzyme family)